MYRVEIDGLRAIAVVSVIINHIDKTLLPNGHLGVDMFYVISGFVITQSLTSRQHGSFKSYILGFYSRRVKRLVPALFLCIAVTCIFVLLIIPPDSALTTSSMRTGMASLFGLSNLYLLRQATDYFGSSAALNPFTYTWSLGVEEQFYFLFPFLLWFSGLPQKRNRGFRNFNLLIGVTAVTSLISYLWLSSVNPIVAFYLMPMRFWELALGAIASQALMKSRGTAGLSPKFALYITVAALVALIAVFFLPWQQSSQGFVTFTVAILTTILIFGIRPGSLVYKLLTLKSLVFLGGKSVRPVG